MRRGKVLQDWMGDLTWKQQSVVLSALRGPDTIRPENIKKIGRWIRNITQNNADPSTEYMQEIKLPELEELAEDLEYCTVHYFCHLLHALEIIGYKDPNKEIADKAKGYYLGLVKALHLSPETEEQLDIRLSDRVRY